MVAQLYDTLGSDTPGTNIPVRATDRTEALRGHINNQRPDVTRVPGVRLKDFTPPAQIYSQQIWTRHTVGVDQDTIDQGWLDRTVAANDWMNNIDYTTDGKIINISQQIFDSPIEVNGTTGAVFNIYNSVFNAEINIGVEWVLGNNANGTSGFYLSEKPLSKRDAFILQIRRQQAPAIIKSRANSYGAEFNDAKPEELVALQLLRSMVEPEVFRKYLKYGFVTVQGPSGLVYQIQRKSHIIKVRKMDKVLCTLCVYVQDQSIPPTDDVVAKMLICECDEVDIWKRANIHWLDAMKEFKRLTSKSIDNTDLQKILRVA
ncbi:MAG: hypothetical protein ACXAC5_04265 [Promethearchaeota archaeon]|jgi:hypothetical protein